MIKTALPMQGMQVQSLVEELGSHMLHGAVKKKKKERKIAIGFVPKVM